MKKNKHKSSVLVRRNNRNGYLFLAPWLLGFILFTAFPFVYTIYLSFNNVKMTVMGFEIKWAGWYNYNVIFFEIIEFVPALLRFILMQIVYVPVILVISFILGLLLNQEIRFRTTFRTIFFLPVIILSGSVMQQFMAAGATSLDSISDLLVFNVIANYSRLIARSIEVLFINFTIVLWFTGIPIVLFINALQKVDRYLYEAAEIDGANWWQILWKIVIPMIKSTALVVSIYTIINLGLYNINPLADGRINILDLIRAAMGSTSTGLGTASAYATVYTIVVLLLIGICLFIFRSKDGLKNEESLRERQLRNLHRIQKRNSKKNITVKEYLNMINQKIARKGEKQND